MAHSFTVVYVHLVFSTKNRYPFLKDPAIQDECNAYITTLLKNKQSPCLAIQTMPDHVHVLFRQSVSLALADCVRDMKRATSKWLHQKGLKKFSWQEGYSAFSVSHRLLPRVCNYIENQTEHHKKKTFEEEYIEFLNEQGLSYDDRYVLG